MLYDVPDKDGKHLTWLFHGGGAPGLKALIAYSGGRGRSSQSPYNDGSAEATANLLLKALK